MDYGYTEADMRQVQEEFDHTLELLHESDLELAKVGALYIDCLNLGHEEDTCLKLIRDESGITWL